jgi:hypothetical protein
MTILLRALILSLLAIALGGCPLFPRKADLEHIHSVYRSEFASTFLGDSKSQAGVCPDKSNPGPATSFPNTLQAIRDYQVKYRDDPATSTERAHLVVLTAMIHLQVGNTGIAASMIDAVAQAKIAAADDREVRDSLFKRAFPHLVDGWRAVCETVDRADKKAEEKMKRRLDRLLDAGKGIIAVSDGVAGPGSAGKPATDEGAVYLATSGAIFRRHAVEAHQTLCSTSDKSGDPSQKIYERCRREAFKQIDIKGAADAIGKFLTEEEKRAAAAAPDAADWLRVVPIGRIQYVHWYSRLSREAAEGAK